jgi:hypothetical protein
LALVIFEKASRGSNVEGGRGKILNLSPCRKILKTEGF